MSVTTKTGDQGTTGLMYNRRVPKSHPRLEAYGSVDELSATLGAARALAAPGKTPELLRSIQRELITLMGELATETADLPRYTRDGFPRVTAALTASLDAQVQALEAALPPLKDWVIPGANPAAAALDVARATCRRAERRVSALLEAGHLDNREILTYLNRLGDVLFLLARAAERPPA